MSGILGNVLHDVLNDQQVGKPAALRGILQEVLSGGQGQSGGISALISRFEQAGLGEHAQSWLTNGQNKPVSSEQIGQVFSSQEIDSWAQQAGTTPDKMKQVLAEALPHVVDHATPNGTVPAQAPDLSGLLGGLLSKYV
jgi:uncharacterized protein YidB (DUF937 family)